jgi:hypothetical protein
VNPYYLLASILHARHIRKCPACHRLQKVPATIEAETFCCRYCSNPMPARRSRPAGSR